MPYFINPEDSGDVRETGEGESILGWDETDKKTFTAAVEASEKAEADHQATADAVAAKWVPEFQAAQKAGFQGQATDAQVEILLNPPASFAAAVKANNGKAKK